MPVPVLDQNDFVTTMAVFWCCSSLSPDLLRGVHRHCLYPVHDHRPHQRTGVRRPAAPGGAEPLPVPVRKGQVSKVFLVPAIVGTAVISAFYLMIMYFNDNRFTPGEMAGMAVCAAVIAVLSAVL